MSHVLFNDALKHIVMYGYTMSNRKSTGASSQDFLSMKEQGIFYMCLPTDRVIHTMAFVTLVVKHWLDIGIVQANFIATFVGFAFQLSYITHTHAHTQTNTHTLVTRIYLKHLNLVFSFQPVLHDWCNKGCGMCYPVCGIVHIKEPLLIIGKSLCGGSGFPLSLSEWSFTICPMPYNHK